MSRKCIFMTYFFVLTLFTNCANKYVSDNYVIELLIMQANSMLKVIIIRSRCLVSFSIVYTHTYIHIFLWFEIQVINHTSNRDFQDLLLIH